MAKVSRLEFGFEVCFVGVTGNFNRGVSIRSAMTSDEWPVVAREKPRRKEKMR
jgi:hypothetical protein